MAGARFPRRDKALTSTPKSVKCICLPPARFRSNLRPSPAKFLRSISALHILEQRKISRFDSRRRANCRGLCSRVPRGAPPLCRKVLRCQKSAALQWKAAGRRAEKRAAARTGSGALVPISVPASAARAAQKHASAIPRRRQMPRGGAKRKARFKPLSGGVWLFGPRARARGPGSRSSAAGMRMRGGISRALL